MHFLIVTSVDHCYANILLGVLLRRGVFARHRVTVLEQHGLIPGKTKLDGLLRYLRISGFPYVSGQIVKQYLFQTVRLLRSIQGRQSSVYYPYWHLSGPQVVRMRCPHLASAEVIALMGKLKPDCILSLYSKEVIPERMFSFPRLGCVNLHPAPLPFYRGISPTFWILARGEQTAGVTLHRVDRGLDTGPIISQKLFPAKGYTDEHALYLAATRYGATLVEDFITSLSRGKHKRMKLRPNPKAGSYYRLPTRGAVNEFFRRGCRFFRWRDFFRL
ncbi:hypothetical protein HY949_03760 [Candidatus Gottesmanbacteria bacterium]|nr:hypothetical protein [Candidatus Gottesmanbacteria bacterium]